MAEYDGSVVIKTAIDTSGFQNGTKEIEKAAKDAAEKIQAIANASRAALNVTASGFTKSTTACRKQITAIKDLEKQLLQLRVTQSADGASAVDIAAISRYEKEIDRITQKMEKMRESEHALDSTQTEDYQKMSMQMSALAAELDILKEKSANAIQGGNIQAELNAQIEKTSEKMDILADKMETYENVFDRQHAEWTQAFGELQRQLDETRSKYDAVIDRQSEVAASVPTETTTAETVSSERALLAVQEQQTQILEQLNAQYAALREVVETSTRSSAQSADMQRQAIEQTAQAYNALQKAATNSANTVVRDHKRMADSGEEAHKRIQKHSNVSFKTILKYGFGVRSVFILYRRLRGAAAESLKALAQYDPALNSIVSKFLTAVAQLKADIGTILQPIVSSVVPVLTWLLEKLHNVLLRFAELVAVITGQDYIETITVQTVDWANSIDKVTKSAKEATKALGGYDKLNVISGGGDGAGGGAGGGSGSGKASGGKTPEPDKPKRINLSEWAKKLKEIREEAINVAVEYFEAYDEGGVKGVAGKMLENLGEVMLELQKHLPKPVQNALEALQETTEEYFEHGLVEGFAENADYVREFAVDELADAMYEASKTKPPIQRRANRAEQELDERIAEEKKRQEEVYRNSLKYAKQQERYHNTISGYYDRLARERKDLVDNGKKLLSEFNRAFKAKNGASVLDVGKRFVDANKNTTNKIKTVASSVTDGFKSVFGGIARAIDPTLKVQDFVNDMGTSVKNGLTALGNTVKSSGIGEKAKNIGISIKNSIVSAFKFGNNDNVKAATELGDAADTLTRTIGTTTVVHKRIANVGSVVAKVVAGGFKVSDADKNKVSDEIANTFSGKKESLNKRATELGKSVIAKVASGMTPTEADKETAEKKVTQLPSAVNNAAKGGSTLFTRLQTLGKTMSGVITKNTEMTDAEKADVAKSICDAILGINTDTKRAASPLGKSLITTGGSISEVLKKNMQFTEQDGKDTANALAKGIETVGAEANRKGSALYNALLNVGKKITEGISNGTITIPTNTGGKTIPTNNVISKVYEQITSQVQVILDGKVISETVFNEAKKQQKQTGDGAKAFIKWAFL